MQIQSVLFLAFAALGFAYDKDINHKGVTYHVAGVPDEGVKCSRADARFSKDDLAKVIGELGGEKKGARGKYPEKLGSQNQASLPPLQNGCSFDNGVTLWSAGVGFVDGKVTSWLDPATPKRTPYRIIYRIDENNVYTYCAAAEHPVGDNSNYAGCPS